MTVKGIIEFGSLPSSSYISSSVTYADILASPLDGFCINLADNSANNLSQRLWGYSGTVTGFTESTVSTFITNVAARNTAGWGRVPYNFLVMQTPDKTVDWFSSDIETVVQNLKLLGRVVALTGLYGIMIEPEPYGTYAWDYSQMPLKATYTQAQYEEEVEQRGYEIGLYWGQQKADMSVFLYKSYYVGDTDSRYTFFSNFVDGLYRGLGEQRDNNTKRGFTSIQVPEVQIIHSNNLSYDDADRDEFDRINALQDTYVGSSGRYADLKRKALLVRPDIIEHGDVSYPFNNSSTGSNYFTPARWEDALDLMLATEDLDFVMVYNESYHFFGSGTIINSGYIDAIRNAKKTAGMRQ